MPVRVIGRIAPFTDGAFKVVNAGDLGGVFIKSITAGGLVTYQDSSDVEQTVQLSTAAGGGSFSAGTADPAGGAAGDAYLQVSAANVVQSIWLNEAGYVGGIHIAGGRHRRHALGHGPTVGIDRRERRGHGRRGIAARPSPSGSRRASTTQAGISELRNGRPKRARELLRRV